MKVAVDELIPRVVPYITHEAHDLGCKSQYMKKVGKRLEGYSYMLKREPSWGVVLLRDRDQEDCLQVLKELDHAISQSGLDRASVSGGRLGQVLPRLADEMLEAWFFGDTDAINKSYPRFPRGLKAKRAFRNSDAIRDPARRLEQELVKAGYYQAGRMDKFQVAFEVAMQMNVDSNTSPSFACFREGIRFLTMPRQEPKEYTHVS